MVARGEIAALFVFVNPLSSHPHDADIEALSRICNVQDTMFANNPSTAQSIVLALEYSAIGYSKLQQRKDSLLQNQKSSTNTSTYSSTESNHFSMGTEQQQQQQQRYSRYGRGGSNFMMDSESVEERLLSNHESFISKSYQDKNALMNKSMRGSVLNGPRPKLSVLAGDEHESG